MIQHDQRLNGWSDDARKAIVENPDYFVWWYTVKSVGLAVSFAALALMVGRELGRRRKRKPAGR